MGKTSSNPPPVAALVGKDCFLQLAGLSELLRLLPPDTQRTDLDGESAPLSDVLDEVRSFAMFGGGGKAVTVRNADAFITKHRAALEDYLAAPCDSAMLILRVDVMKSNERIYKLIDKVGRIISCNPPKDLGKWILDRAAAEHKLKLSSDAARMLADQVGDDLGRLDNELAKLALCTDSGSISAGEVSAQVAFQRERDMWDMTNALGAGDTAGALRRWRQLVQLESSAEFRAVMWLGLWLENVRRALAMLARGESAFAIGQAARIWDRQAQQQFVQTCQRLGRPGLDRALDLLAKIDYQTKTGVGDAVENVERFILSLAVQ